MKTQMVKILNAVMILVITGISFATVAQFANPTPTAAAVEYKQWGVGFSFWIVINGKDLEQCKKSTTYATNCANRAADQIINKFFNNVKKLSEIEKAAKIFGVPIPGAASLTTGLLKAGLSWKISGLIKNYAKYSPHTLIIVVNGPPNGPTPADWRIEWN